MKLCKNCEPIACCCDFCKYYDFNADKQGMYTGDGYCRKHKRQADPAEVCDDFHCIELVKKKRKKLSVNNKK